MIPDLVAPENVLSRIPSRCGEERGPVLGDEGLTLLAKGLEVPERRMHVLDTPNVVALSQTTYNDIIQITDE
jgi:hypothetical protein